MTVADPGPPPPLVDAQDLNRQIQAVHTISRLLSSTLDLDERLRGIPRVAADAVDATAGSIALYRAGDNKLVYQYSVGPKANEFTGFEMKATDGVAGAVFQSGEPLITNRPRETTAHRADVDRKTGFTTENMVTVPLKYQAGSPIGVMQILNKQHGEFNTGDLAVLEIVASIAAAAIENAQLHRDAQLAAVAHAVGDLSHDIKNKVTPISMTVYTLRPTIEAMLDDLARIEQNVPSEVAAKLNQATEYLRQDYGEQFDIIMDQVQQIQDYTKLIADAVKGIVTEPQLELHELAPIIEGQLKDLSMQARGRSVSLVRQLEPVPICRFDRFLVERAIYNLVNNAIPETPEGGCITVRTWAVMDGSFPDGRFVIIEVRDTGHGMPPHILERILRGDAKSTKPGGTGLGTRIVYNAVAAHKGIFEGESMEGVGTVFRLKLPLITV
jgi:signal transduction histidine kinase